MGLKPVRTSRGRWWLNVPIMVGGFVLFMTLAAVTGSLGTREQRSSGNTYWPFFLSKPLVGLEEAAVIGTWRKDRQHWEGVGPDHCGIKVYALPEDPPGGAVLSQAEGALWARPSELLPLGSLTGMTASFCEGPVRLMTVLHRRILAAWTELENERFCEVDSDGAATFAGVLDHKESRAYTWFSADTKRRSETTEPAPGAPDRDFATTPCEPS